MKKANQVLRKAERLAATLDNWADLCNALFDPVNGLITTTYPTPVERTEFVKSAQYRKIRGLIGRAIDKSGLVAGSRPRKSGRFVVRIPESLHASLEQEALREGVSLNQLVTAKLAIQLKPVGQGVHAEQRRKKRAS